MVFISYSSLDSVAASEVKAVLETNGFQVWMAPDSIPPSSDYGEMIPGAIRNCGVFLLLLTENSQESIWCPKELDLAIQYEKPIVPFHLDDSLIRDSFNFRLSNVQRIDAFIDKNSSYAKLISVLAGILGANGSKDNSHSKLHEDSVDGNAEMHCSPEGAPKKDTSPAMEYSYLSIGEMRADIEAALAQGPANPKTIRQSAESGNPDSSYAQGGLHETQSPVKPQSIAADPQAACEHEQTASPKSTQAATSTSNEPAAIGRTRGHVRTTHVSSSPAAKQKPSTPSSQQTGGGTAIPHPHGSNQSSSIVGSTQNHVHATIAIGAAVVIIALVLLFANMFSSSTGSVENAIQAKETLQSYSWDELSAISAEISAAEDEDSVSEIAKKYNLVDDNGELDSTQTKLVRIDGEDQPVRIIGFAHDKRTDGGLAGITFQFVNCIDENAMNNWLASDSEYERYAQSRGVSVSQLKKDHPNAVPTNTDGWEGSSMRNWLDTSVLPALPEELQNVIVAVDKETNNTGKTSSKKSVTTTSDKLWLLSKVELCGTKNCDSKVTRAEGTPYQLFNESGVGSQGDSSLKKALEDKSLQYWWLRSAAAQSDLYFLVIDKDGEFNLGWSDKEYGVAPCFCI